MYLVAPVILIALGLAAFVAAQWVMAARGVARRRTETPGAPLLAGLLAGAGTAREAPRTIDRTVHVTGWGMRLLMLVTLATGGLTVVLTWGGEAFATQGPSFWWSLVGAFALLVWFVLWFFAFRVEHDRDTLSVLGMDFRMHDYPLAGLIGLREDGPYVWKLYFEDGPRVRVMKMVVGAPALRQRLAQVRRDNLRG